MDYAWYDLLGNIGVALIIGAYLLLQLGRMDGRGLPFAGANALGAALILVSLAYDFNLSAAIVEGFWLAISLFGVFRGLAGRRRRLQPPAPDLTGRRR